MNATESHADEFEVVVGQHQRPIHQPGPAGRRERAFKIWEGNVAPVIVVSGRAVDRLLDLLNESKRFRCKTLVFHEIAGETDKFGRQLVDRANHVRRILHVAFMMEIGEVDEAAIAPAAGSRFPHSESTQAATSWSRASSLSIAGGNRSSQASTVAWRQTLA